MDLEHTAGRHHNICRFRLHSHGICALCHNVFPILVRLHSSGMNMVRLSYHNRLIQRTEVDVNINRLSLVVGIAVWSTGCRIY